MFDHLTQTEIEAYRHRQLKAVDLLIVSDHLGSCQMCRRQVERALSGDAACLALRDDLFSAPEFFSSPIEPTHLTFEQIAGLIDGGDLPVDELQVVKDHVTCCEQCNLAVDDLRAFKAQVGPVLDRENRLSSVSATAESLWQRLVASWLSFWPKSPTLVFGSALAGLLLVAVGWLVWQTIRRTEGEPKIASTTPSPNTSSSVPSAESEMLIAQLNDGKGEVRLDQRGQLSGVDHLPPAYQQMVKKALADQEIERSPLLAGLTQQGSRARGEGGDEPSNKFSLIEPLGVVTLSDRPAFRWSRLDGATSYVVEVYDENFDLAAISPQVTEHSWMAPQSLKRGRIYYWQVKAYKEGQEVVSTQPPALQAKFRILDQAKANELSEARRNYVASHLTLGLLYAQSGLLDEAEREFLALQKANPNSVIASRLLSQVRTRSK